MIRRLSRTRRVRLLRIAYWYGAVLDALAVVPLLLPGVAGRAFGLADFHPGSDYRYASYVGAALMAGWTALLLWADQRPAERRGVLMLTAFPVVTGLVCAAGYANSSGLISAGKVAPLIVLPSIGAILFVAAYLHASPRYLPAAR